MLGTPLTTTLPSPISLCIFAAPELFIQFLSPIFDGKVSTDETPEPYFWKQFSTIDSTLDYLQTTHVDCLIAEESPKLQPLLDSLAQQEVFFPTVLLITSDSSETPSSYHYHSAVLQLPIQQSNQLGLVIDQAISQFIQLQPQSDPMNENDELTSSSLTHRLMAQQLRLAEKLKERLDYLGVYYKRNSQNFLRYMTPPQREDLLRQLKADYRDIILVYFSNEPRLNEKIDNFVNTAFFADVPISRIVELHMELMDEFSKQLKLEGRSDDILLDYRLTLIDTLAHLCEMYRRSIPRES